MKVQMLRLDNVLLHLYRIKNNVNVDFAIVSLILVLVIIPTGIYSTSLPVAVFGQSDDDDNSSEDNEGNNTPDSSISSSGNSKLVILTFDDGYKSQYTTAKPILDKYGFKGTFYVVCNYAQKIDTDRMNWTEVKELYPQGHDIGSHTMNHQDLTQIPPERIDYEVGISKQCINSQGMNVFRASHTLLLKDLLIQLLLTRWPSIILLHVQPMLPLCF